MASNAYIKHLVECNCVLPQFRDYRPVVFHKFTVFSELDENGNVIPSFAECPNCSAIHKVVEVFESKTLRKETITTLPRKEELGEAIPRKVVELLERYGCDTATWQEARFIVEHELWGKPVILSRDEVDGTITGKYVLILGKDLLKVDTYVREADEFTR